MEVVCGQNGPQFAFELLLHSYLNSGAMDTTGQPCRSNINQGCRNRFTFCAHSIGADDCSLGQSSFDLNTGTDLVTFTDGVSIVTGVSNPLTFTAAGGPLASECIPLECHDDNNLSNSLIFRGVLH